jgi:ADP-ribose pyrophosphatase YjhB (NUDIX family)
MNKENVPVCCVICINENGEILLIKRGKEPFRDKWSLISGVGYAKKNLTPEQGVYDEVVWDVIAQPFEVEYLFAITGDESEIQVFKAEVEPQDVAPREPDVPDAQWYSLDEVSKLGELGFEHSEILRMFSEL